MKKILVTGSLGYIGSVLVPYLKNQGHDCVGYDVGFFRDCLFFPADDGEVTISDMRYFDESSLEGVDIVVHLAGISNDPFGDMSISEVYDPVRQYSRKLACLCRQKGIRLIFMSSCSVYGRSEGMVDENSVTNPQTSYSLNKLQIENDLIKLSDGQFSPVILRLATVFGVSARMRFDIVVNMFAGMAFATKQIVLNSDGMAWRPNVHILDVCKAISYAIEHNAGVTDPVILNVGNTNQNQRILQIAEMICDIADSSEIVFLRQNDAMKEENELIRDRKLQDGVDSRTYQVSFEKIKNVFEGFECEWTLEHGIRELLVNFAKYDLTEDVLRDRRFYRLQQMEYLYSQQRISKDLTRVKISTI